MENYEIQWKKALEILENSINPISFSTYIKKLKAIDLDDGALVLSAPSTMFATGTLRLSEKIIEALKSAETGLKDFKLYVANGKTPFFSTANSESLEDTSSPIDPKYTFESFVVGNSNRSLYAAAQAVSDDPGRSYNPLFIYGSTGLGKTHIMHAIANAIKKNRPEMKVLYATCEKFTNDLISAIRQGKAYTDGGEEFRTRYRNVDVLIIDDVQFLSKKQSTQEEFFHTFNELYGRNKQIILSSDCPPKEISLLEERLTTRFQSGLMAEVLPPDLETRIAILQRKAEEKKYILNFEVASYLAETADSDVRSLEGLLNKVIFASRLKELPITLTLAMDALAMAKPEGTHVEIITTTDIINTVCSFYKLSKTDLLGKKKNKEFVKPRQICTYLITELMDIPLLAVGQAMGGRDHTTVIYTRDKIAALIEKDMRVATEINDLKNLIRKK